MNSYWHIIISPTPQYTIRLWARANGLQTSHVFLCSLLPGRRDRTVRVDWNWASTFPWLVMCRISHIGFGSGHGFFWGQTLRTECSGVFQNECSGVFQNGSFPHHPAGSTRGYFSNIFCGNLCALLKVRLTKVCPPPPWLGLQGFHSETCPHWFSSNWSNADQVYCPSTGPMEV
jgi:hypothetical protein